MLSRKPDERITYRFRATACELYYTFGHPSDLPILADKVAHRHEESYSLEVTATLEAPVLKALKGTSLRLVATSFDLDESVKHDRPRRPIGMVERSRGHLRGYVFLPHRALDLVRDELAQAPGLDIMLFAPPLVKLRADVTNVVITRPEPEPES